jgi:hypothetical protein
VAYHYLNSTLKKEIEIIITGSGNEINNHILLPQNCVGVKSVFVDGQPVNFTLSKIENSSYTDFNVALPMVHLLKINYK